MSGKIITLDKTLVNQIAAWEVVDRPVSVVKELVENSIDAGTSFIKIEISEWWKREIIITDNWEGIKKDELHLVPEKYSTSKIKTLDDLYNIMTFWFRWEAISSISSVSRFKIISKTKNSTFAYSIEVNNWEISNISEDALDNWTKIIVKDLFYNTPARLNYLKKDKTETSHIWEFINNISLSYPHIWFEFVSDNRSVCRYNSWEDLKTRIYNIYWKDFSTNLLQLNFSLNWMDISWYISDPKVSFNNRNRQVLFVNNRVIKSPIIYKAISNAYNRFIPHSSFSAYIINLKIVPTLVDVNVHPRKMEVRFANEQSIFSSFYKAIQNKLESVSLVGSNPSLRSSGLPLEKEEINKYYTGSGTKFKSYSPYKDVSSNPDQFKIRDSLNFTKEILNESLGSIESGLGNDLHNTALWKVIGQSFNSYIIVETEYWLKILDQHALAERVIYEKLVKGKYEAKIQGLIIWESLNLTSVEFDILKNNEKIFGEIWFDFEFMSWKIVVINWVPDFIKKENIKNIFLWILKDVWEEKSSNIKTLDEVRNRIFAFTACRSAIKFGNKLNLFEMNKLLNDSVIDYSATCPHGRPVIYQIWLDELKGKYER